MPEVATRQWTRAEYERMVTAGILGPSDHVELLDGEIVIMTPEGTAHATAVGLVCDALQARLPEHFHIRTEQPFGLEDRSEPEPDVVVVPGGRRDYRNSHPTTARLLVEVADSSLERDQQHKLAIYARAQVAEYWILNLVEGQLEISRQPIPSSESRTGWSYHHRTVLRPNDEVVPFPDAAPIRVQDLLP